MEREGYERKEERRKENYFNFPFSTIQYSAVSYCPENKPVCQRYVPFWPTLESLCQDQEDGCRHRRESEAVLAPHLCRFLCIAILFPEIENKNALRNFRTETGPYSVLTL